MADYSRDQDIGKATVPTHLVEVQNFASVITAIESAVSELQEAVRELRKISTGTEVIIGDDIEEVG